MPEDNLILGADAAQFIAQLEKATAALLNFFNQQDKIVTQAAKVNSATNQIQTSISAVAKTGESAVATFKKIGKEWELVSSTTNTLNKTLHEVTNNINQIGASAARTAVKMGDFTRARAAAQTIQDAPIRQKVITEIETAQTQQPIDTRLFARNLRRGYEDAAKDMPAIWRSKYQELIRETANAAARMGITWDQFKARVAAARTGRTLPPVAGALEGEQAAFNKSLNVLTSYYDRLDKVRETSAKRADAINTARAGAIRALQIEEQRNLAQSASIATKRADIERQHQLESQKLEEQTAKRSAEANLRREAALRVMQAEQSKVAATQKSIVQLGQDYNTFLDQQAKGLITVGKAHVTTNQAINQSGKIITTVTEAYNGVTVSGDKFQASVTKVNGKLREFNTTSTQAKIAVDQQQQAQQQMVMAQARTAEFMQRLNAGMLTQRRLTTTETESLNVAAQAAGQKAGKIATLNETYRVTTQTGEQWIATVSKQGGVVVDFSKKVDQAAEANKQLYLSWQSIIRMFTLNYAFMALNTMTSGMRQAIAAAQELQITIAQIQTISEQDLNVNQWAQGILAISNATGLLAQDIAKGTYDTLSNQIADGTAALGFMTQASQLAIVTNSSLQDTINAVSSAMNSYGMGLEEQTRIQDVFFRMIDLGRIKMPEFANSLGRILPAANQLGVSLEEVAATLSVLTRAGVTPANAMTSLFNIFSRLLKPAGAMKEFLKGIGVESGRAAIQTRSFIGVFNEIAKFTEGKPELIAELFPDIRGLRAALDLAGPRIVQFNKDLDAMKNSSGAVSEAMEYFNKNPGKQFQIELNKIDNYLTSVGNTMLNLIKFVADWTVGIDKISGSFKFLTQMLLAVGGPLIVAGFVSLLRHSEALKSVWDGLFVSLGKIRGVQLPTGAALLGAAAAGVAVKMAIDAYADSLVKASDAQRKFWKDQEAQIKQAAAKSTEALTQTIERNAEQLRAYVAFFNKVYNKESDGLLKLNKAAVDEFKNLTAALSDTLKEAMNKVKESLKQVTDQLETIEKFAKTAPEQLRKLQLDWKLEVTKEPLAKQKLLLEELIRAEKELEAAADPEDRIKKYEHYIDVVKQLRDVWKENEEAKQKDAKLDDDLIEQRKKAVQDLEELRAKAVVKELKDEEKRQNLAKKSTVVTSGGRVIPTDRRTAIQAGSEAITASERKRKEEELLSTIATIDERLQDQIDRRIKILDFENLSNEALKRTLELNSKQTTILTASKAELKGIIDNYELIIKAADRTASEIERFDFKDLLNPEIDKEKFNELLQQGLKNLDEQQAFAKKYASDDFKLRTELNNNIAKQRKQLLDAQNIYERREASKTALRQIQILEEAQKVQRDKLQANLLVQERVAQQVAEQFKKQSVDTIAQLTTVAQWWEADIPKNLYIQLKAAIDAFTITPNEKGLKQIEFIYGLYVKRLEEAMKAVKASPETQATVLKNLDFNKLLDIGKPLAEAGKDVDEAKKNIAVLEKTIKDQTAQIVDRTILDKLILEMQQKQLESQKDVKNALDNLRKTMILLKLNVPEEDLRKMLPQLEPGNVPERVRDLGIDFDQFFKKANDLINSGMDANKAYEQIIKQMTPATAQTQTGLINKLAMDTGVPIEELSTRLSELTKTEGSVEKAYLVLRDQIIVQSTQTAKATQSSNEVAKSNASLGVDLRALRASVDTLNQAIAAPVEPPTVELPPKTPELKAMGGFMHGSDRIPALLSRGEFVVNAAATRRFYSQLVSMNRIQGFAQGGLVTNVGDINLTMQSTGAVQSDIVAIGKGLQREIRRGRIKF